MMASRKIILSSSSENIICNIYFHLKVWFLLVNFKVILGQAEYVQYLKQTSCYSPKLDQIFRICIVKFLPEIHSYVHWTNGLHQMYRRNEKAFEHDVRRFMDRNGMRIGASPVWQNTPITLFQLFITVLELGGFHSVSHTENGRVNFKAWRRGRTTFASFLRLTKLWLTNFMAWNYG